jgi:hypothetical protein
MEKWKRIKGYDYEVSSTGRVRNLSGKILKEKTDDGYKRIGLYQNKKQVFFRVHRLVAAAFIPKIRGKEQVHHINHIRHDNRVENLQWVTGEENQYYRSANTLSYRFLLKFYKKHNNLKSQRTYYPHQR